MEQLYGHPRLPPGLLERPRIHALFDAEAAITVVRGSAGSGKTVAVADWVSQTTTPGIWLTIDRGSNAAAAFWSAIVQLLVDAELVAPRDWLVRGVR